MLSILLLGYPTFSIDDIPIEIPRRKALALFVYLVATRRSHTREHLCALLWSDQPAVTARAELRRMLSTLKRTRLAPFIESDREIVQLVHTEAMRVDIWELDALLRQGNWPAISTEINRWVVPFLNGLHLDDAPTYDDWQHMMTTQIQQRLLLAIEQLALQSQMEGNYHDCIRLLNAWLSLSDEDETVHRWLMRSYVQSRQTKMALDHYHHLRARHEPLEAETIALAQRIEAGEPIEHQRFAKGFLPPIPQLFVGREEVLRDLKKRLGIHPEKAREPYPIIIQGWPGIGKTTLTMALAHDILTQRHFQDGIFWASLGQKPDVLAILVQWGLAIGLTDIRNAQNIAEASAHLARALHQKRILLIIDDVWDEMHLPPFKIGGTNSALIITTRLNRVAQALVMTPNELYKVPLLDNERAYQLLSILAGDAVEGYPEEIQHLIQDLEGLPLALQVAGRLLREEHSFGWSVRDLLQELREGARLLQARAPADRQNPDDNIPLTVSALLTLSTQALDPLLRDRFAMLGVFAPKPAIFDMGALQAVWNIPDPRPTVRQLVGRGLLEVVHGVGFQMHALLVKHARDLFDNQPQ